MPNTLPDFHPFTPIREWGNRQAFRIADALTGISVFSATGSGKTSGVAKHLALGDTGKHSDWNSQQPEE